MLYYFIKDKRQRARAVATGRGISVTLPKSGQVNFYGVKMTS